MSSTHYSSEQITAAVLRIVAETQRKDLALITPDASFEQLGIDSMDAVNIIFALENEFDINVPDDKLKEIRTVSAMIQGVEQLLAAKAATISAGASSGPAAS